MTFTKNTEELSVFSISTYVLSYRDKRIASVKKIIARKTFVKKIRSAVLFSTALSGICLLSSPVLAQELCTSAVFKTCVFNRLSSTNTIGSLIYAGQVISADAPSLTNNTSLTDEMAVNSVSGKALIPVGAALYNALNGANITNNGSIEGFAPSNNSAPTTQTFGVGIYNDTSGTLSLLNNSFLEGNGGIGFGVDNLGTISTLTNSTTATIEGLGGLTNDAGIGVENQGTINIIYNAGMISGLGAEGGGNAGGTGGEGAAIANINNVSIATLTNNGTLEGTGGYGNGMGGGGGDGIDNWGGIAALTNNAGGLIEGIGGADSEVAGNGTGIFNEAGSSLVVLTNNDTIEGTGGEATSFSGGNGTGLDNFGSINTLTNSASSIIEGNGNNGAYGGNGTGLSNEAGGIIGTLTNSGIIEGALGTGSSSEYDGSAYGIVNSGAINELSNSGTISGVTDALYLAQGSTIGTLHNSGVISGDIDNESGQALTIDGGTGNAEGTLEGFNSTSGTITSDGTNLDFESGNLLLNDNLVASGVTNSGANLLVNNSISSSSPFAVIGGILEVGDTTDTSANLSSDVYLSGIGVLRGYGSITGNVTNDATIYPGQSIGTLSINGNYTQNQDGTLEVDVNPTTNNATPVAGIDYDQLIVSGTATLNGELLINAAAPGLNSSYVVGSDYNVLSAKTISGNFSSIDLAGAYAKYLTATLVGVTTGANGNEVDQIALTINQGNTPNNAGPSGNANGQSSSTPNDQTVTSLEGDQPVNLDGTTLTDTGSGSQTFSGSISGTGGLTQNGSGTLTLTGTSSYTGPTTVQSGVLEVGTASSPDASITSNVGVTGSGILRGHGSVGSIQNSGTVSPGGTIGILTVNGVYQQTNSGVLAIEITPNTTAGVGYDQLNVNGSAVLDGTLNIIADTPNSSSAYQVGSAYNVLVTTQGITGSFSTISLSGTYAQYLTASNQITDDNLVDEVVINPVSDAGGPADTNSEQGLQNAPAFRSGQTYGASLYAQNQSLFAALSSPEQTQQGFWMNGLGSFGHTLNADYSYKGFVIGHGFALSPRFIIGGGLANIYTNTKGENSSSVDGTNVGGEVYGIYTLPRLTITGTLAAGHIGNTSKRNLPGIGAGKFNNNGSYEGASLFARYNGYERGNFFVSPYTQAAYLHTHTGAGNESGLGILNLQYGSITTSLAQLGGGVTGGYRSITNLGELTTSVRLGGLGTLGNIHPGSRETLGLYNATEAELVAPNGAYTPAVTIQLVGKNAPWTIGAKWNGQFTNHTNSQSFALEGNYKW